MFVCVVCVCVCVCLCVCVCVCVCVVLVCSYTFLLATQSVNEDKVNIEKYILVFNGSTYYKATLYSMLVNMISKLGPPEEALAVWAFMQQQKLPPGTKTCIILSFKFHTP